jgi:hypothetical protein
MNIYSVGQMRQDDGAVAQHLLSPLLKLLLLLLLGELLYDYGLRSTVNVTIDATPPPP